MFHAANATKANARDMQVRSVRRNSELHTDEIKLYTETGKELAGHHTVKHSAEEYVRYKGEQHLHRYLSDFEFRYNRRRAPGGNDAMCADAVLKAIGGKRLT